MATLPPIANLCERCCVLEFDDSTWPGAYQAGSGSKGTHLRISKKHRNYRFKLDYFLLDSAPEFPWLSDTADKGCDFCVILKKVVGRYVRDCFDELTVSLFYEWYRGDDSMELDGGSFGLKSLVAELLWIGLDEKGDHLSSSMWLQFDIDSPSGPCARWLRLVKPPYEDALCSENLDMILHCLNQSGHSEIRTLPIPQTKAEVSPRTLLGEVSPIKMTRYPTRLIDIGGGGGVSCRLIETGSNTKFKDSILVPYTTLSYCWGPEEDSLLQFKTERKSLQQRLSGFEIHEVSPIVRDAIRVTQALGIRYLWVDALCIIQDDRQDWARESTRMSHVYRNATVTICTPASTSCQQGFLARNWIATRLRFQSQINKAVVGSYTIRFIGDVIHPFRAAVDCLTFSLSYSQWNLRAWVLQEYESSQRVLVFGRARVHVITESGAQSESSKRVEPSITACGTKYIKNDERDAETAYLNWLNIVEEYSLRKLTDPLDRLPAISGLATTLHPVRYLAGHMIPYIDLFWTTLISFDTLHLTREMLLDSLQSRYAYVAPSWSWASRGQPIEFGERRFKVLSGPDPAPVEQECELEGWTSLTSDSPFGRVSNGCITIRGVIVPFQFQMRSFVRVGSHDIPWRASEDGEYVADISLDWNESGGSESFKELSLVLIGSRQVEDDLSWDPVQIVYEHEIKDDGPNLNLRDPTMDMWVIGGIPDASHLGSSKGKFGYDNGRLVYGMSSTKSAKTKRHHDQPLDNATGGKGNEMGGKIREALYSETEAHTKLLSLNSNDRQASESGLSKSDDRYAYGLVIHPASEPGKYLRVGVFHSVPRERGGLQYFRKYPTRTVEII
ncbi:HET-domain-containing protein [Hypoxylon trugodes]|uniref:HET-domain-containing protein n=1 Tax=Hypoxylon trugodes TaxID=326681 RepID=UPI00219A501D|nr:HET-domain-containing protein [Hypoxylon trugodes]KAI1389007.1 HET-domain-containing protein [Hypoxylon trugodes]